ncbi:HD domain-containing protein [Mariniblastus fucicola]|uniref:Multifunctional CCA protein n=1 Tax=Mariniblastus fucicola TaxID=980251 RepID=A0A5B9PB51_9BACT|nr:HD domain-containing protein [Mariniblastus fucicola]QEG22152.1 Multifunctional CCA protein [Mariniblastus fucicola]
MANSKLRRQIAWQAARLMYDRQESEYYRAKMKAARICCKGWVKPKDLPSNAEIREEIQHMARMLEGETNDQRLFEMRIEALRVMRVLAQFRTRLIGSVLTGHIRSGSDIDLHVFCDSLESVTGILDSHGFNYEIERKRVVKDGERQVYEHVHIKDRFEVELTVYPTSKASFVFKSSITGKPIERASEAQLIPLMQNFYPDVDIEAAIEESEEKIDPFQLFYALLLPLENVKQNPQYHPEGDALYHSLQVYDLACHANPWDEEFLLAALLHDVGKGIDPYDHVDAGVDAICDFVSDRTLWLVKHHMLAHKIFDQTIGARKRKRLQENENYEDLVLLGRCDREGRKQGIETTELEAALEYIRTIGHQWA